jgi:hypothetical protein
MMTTVVVGIEDDYEFLLAFYDGAAGLAVGLVDQSFHGIDNYGFAQVAGIIFA